MPRTKDGVCSRHGVPFRGSGQKWCPVCHAECKTARLANDPEAKSRSNVTDQRKNSRMTLTRQVGMLARDRVNDCSLSDAEFRLIIRTALVANGNTP